MTQLAADRSTLLKPGDFFILPVAANTVIFAGSLVCINTTGHATPGAVSTSLKAVGRAEEYINNNPGLAGAQMVKVRRGVFLFENDETNPVTAADVLKDCFVVDDQTLSISNGATAGNPATRSKAGRVLEVESGGGVWVEILEPRKLLDTVDANLPGDVEFTIGAEAASIRVSGQLKTVDDENVDGKKLVNIWLSDAAGGTVCAVAPSGTVAIGTAGVILQNLIAKLNFQIITGATGAFNIDITEAGAKELYVNVAWNGKVFTSDLVTFTAE
jgi:hypothetical protein